MTEIVPVNDMNRFMPVMALQDAIARRNAIVEFVQKVMVQDKDFGVIPGTDKPTLLKPGAEKLNTLFGFTSRFTVAEKETDWIGAAHDGESFFYFLYRCQLWRGDLLVAEGDGSCNSMEKKYRYREAQRVCPECGKPAIIKGKAEYGGGWLCFKKKGGCGAKFRDDDAAITSQQVGQVLNPDIADLVNTVQKMAQKRALIAATLLAVNASEFFTQDIEDMDIIEVSYEMKNQPKQTAQELHFNSETLANIYSHATKAMTNPNMPLDANPAMLDAFKAARGQANDRGLVGDIAKYGVKTKTPCAEVVKAITGLLTACQDADEMHASAHPDAAEGGELQGEAQ